MLQILRGFSRDSVELKTSKQEVFNNLNVSKLFSKALYNCSKKTTTLHQNFQKFLYLQFPRIGINR